MTRVMTVCVVVVVVGVGGGGRPDSEVRDSVRIPDTHQGKPSGRRGGGLRSPSTAATDSRLLWSHSF